MEGGHYSRSSHIPLRLCGSAGFCRAVWYRAYCTHMRLGGSVDWQQIIQSWTKQCVHGEVTYVIDAGHMRPDRLSFRSGVSAKRLIATRKQKRNRETHLAYIAFHGLTESEER